MVPMKSWGVLKGQNLRIRTFECSVERENDGERFREIQRDSTFQ
jgi:hypothetical protein